MARKRAGTKKKRRAAGKVDKFKVSCAGAIARKPRGAFAQRCKQRYPDLAGGVPMDAVPPRRFKKKSPTECNAVLSREMKKGKSNRRHAMKAYWECRRARG